MPTPPGAFEDIKAVVYDFCELRAGQHARKFLGDWQGSLAHARREFFDLYAANQSQLAEFALSQIGKIYEIER